MSTIFFLLYLCNVSDTSVHLDISVSSKENCILSKNVLIFWNTDLIYDSSLKRNILK